MDKQDWTSLEEPVFDELLLENAPDTPPDDLISQITPWRKAMNRVLWGCALTALTLNFLLLNYLLPAIGVVLMLLGFRTLRRENRWFRLCYALSALRCVLTGYSLIRNTTVFPAAPWEQALGVINLLLLLAVFFALWRGLCTLRETSGLEFSTGSAAALLVWYGILFVLAMLGVVGFLTVIAIVVAYVLILRNLFRLSGVLDEAGYAIQAAPVQLSDRWVVRIFAVILAVGIALGYLFGGSYPTAWAEQNTDTTAEVQEIKDHLASLGFPEDILNDLTDADLLSCAGAKQVVVDVMDHPANRGRQVVNRNNVRTEYRTVYDTKELRITGIAVELPDERESWKIIQHFQWLENPGFYGTESIQLWPASRTDEGWGMRGDFTGQVLYDENGKTYISPYFYLGEETYTSSSVLWGSTQNQDLFAAFSLPDRGENHRGYVSYTIQEMVDGYIVDAWINYTHQMTWWQYPVRSAMETRMVNARNDTGTFLTIQDALQFYPHDGITDLINAE